MFRNGRLARWDSTHLQPPIRYPPGTRIGQKSPVAYISIVEVVAKLCTGPARIVDHAPFAVLDLQYQGPDGVVAEGREMHRLALADAQAGKRADRLPRLIP